MASLLPYSVLHLHHNKPATQSPPQHHRITTRRTTLLLLLPLLPSTLLLTQPATAFDFRMTVPDQTLEEAETRIRSHATALLRVKDLLVSESWKEAQKSLRQSSSVLKQDIYTIIGARPAEERRRLRKMYSDLFNAVLRLEYAARDEDRIRVWECYHTIVLYLDDIFSTLSLF